MNKLKELYEKRGSLVKQVRETLDVAITETRGLNADEKTRVDGLENDVHGFDGLIEAEVRQMAREGQVIPSLSHQEARDVAGFDFKKLLNHMYRDANGGRTGVLDGIEAEMIQEGEKEARGAGIQAGGIVLPRMLVRGERRDLTATGTTSVTGDQGGMTIATEKRGLLDDFFNQSVMRRAGATVLEGLTGNLDIPRIAAGTDPAHKAENANADEVTPTFSMLSLTPKRLPAYIDISQQLLLQSSSAIEQILRQHLTNQLLAIQEKAFFHGTGTLMPTGIAATSGVANVALGTNGAAPTLATLIALEAAIDANNALLGNLHFVTNGQVRGKLKSTPRFASTDSVTLAADSGDILGYESFYTNAVSRTLTKGSSSGVASALFFGNFADYYIGYWSGISLEMVRDKANAIAGMYTLVANAYYDGGVARPKSFAMSLDVLGA